MDPEMKKALKKAKELEKKKIPSKEEIEKEIHRLVLEEKDMKKLVKLKPRSIKPKKSAKNQRIVKPKKKKKVSK